MDQIGNIKTKVETIQFFDEFSKTNISFPSSDVDATVNFFESRNFDKVASINVSTVLLAQAKKDGIPIFKILDTLKGLNDLQLSEVVRRILNTYRSKTSFLGVNLTQSLNLRETRNILL